MAAKNPIRATPKQPRAKVLRDAHRICERSHQAAQELFDVFNRLRTSRRSTGGLTTDAEQDLLRAILVFASSGLDATVKQIVRDALAPLVLQNGDARQALVDYAEHRIRRPEKRGGPPERSMDVGFLAAVLAHESPREALLRSFATSLTANSLQSYEQVAHVARQLGIAMGRLCADKAQLKNVFRVRNRIVHEMDIDLGGKTRKRTSRRMDEMADATNVILALAEAFVSEADGLLGKA